MHKIQLAIAAWLVERTTGHKLVNLFRDTERWRLIAKLREPERAVLLLPHDDPHRKNANGKRVFCVHYGINGVDSTPVFKGYSEEAALQAALSYLEDVLKVRRESVIRDSSGRLHKV